MQCPNCKLENPPTAERCDCGYNFTTRTTERIRQECPRCGCQLKKPDWKCPKCYYEFDSNRQQPGVEQSGVGTETALTPHQYPMWIWLIGFGIVITLIISLIQLPPYFRTAILVQRAETLEKYGQEKSAVEFFTNALKITPNSKRVRIGLAISYFRSPDDKDHIKALALLQGLTLKNDEWQRLAAVMPVSYQRFFTNGRK